MNPISNERTVTPIGNQGDVVLPERVSEPRHEIRLDEASVSGNHTRHNGVALNVPLSVSNMQPDQRVLADLGRLLAQVTENSDMVLPRTRGLVSAAFTSPAEFEIELGKLTSELEKTQTKLKLDDIRRAREQNDKKIGENQEKLKEAEESAQKAKKAGIVSKVFGWLSAIASVVIGAIMMATGVGAVAGALMIASGVVGMANMVVQEAAQAGLISKEVMEKLGPALMGIELALAAISLVASFGTSIGNLITKFGSKIGGKVADISVKLVSKAGEMAAKFGSKVGIEALQLSGKTAKLVQIGTQGSDLLLKVGSGGSKTAQYAMEHLSLDAQANLLLNKSEMTQLQAVIDKLKEALSQIMAASQQSMEMIFQMIAARGDMLTSLARRPAAI